MTDATIIVVASAISGSIAAIPAIITAMRQNRVERKVQEVKNIVDGPLSVALKSNAELTAKVAALTGDHIDVKAAMEAKAINENRIEGKSSV